MGAIGKKPKAPESSRLGEVIVELRVAIQLRFSCDSPFQIWQCDKPAYFVLDPLTSLTSGNQVHVSGRFADRIMIGTSLGKIIRATN